MRSTLTTLINGYKKFRKQYANDDTSSVSIMSKLASQGQNPNTMIIACCDSRVDPAIILQCNPGDLFVVRNIASIVPPYEKDQGYHGVSAALEFGIRSLEVKHLILFGHSQCGGMQALINQPAYDSDFIMKWVSLAKDLYMDSTNMEIDELTKNTLGKSYRNCLTFPWIKSKVLDGSLMIHLWFFEIKNGEIFAYSQDDNKYHPL